MLTDIRRKLFIFQQLKGIGVSTLKTLAESPGFATASIDDLGRLNKRIGKALAKPKAWEEAVRRADRDMEAAGKLNARIICLLDDEFPRILKLTPDNPFFLYVRGQLAQKTSRPVAIIGTRNPTEHGKIITKRITKFFVEDGWSIISGLAFGCDAIAHKTALELGGHTVAVLAHGLHTIAPKKHENLANRILDNGGALVTEYGFGIEPFPHQFVKRDRIQAGLARGVVMIQSNLGGGSLHASRAAIDYKRILAVAKPAELDVSRKEENIAANQVLSGENTKDKKILMKCKEEKLKHIFIIRSKDDYAQLSEKLATVETDLLG